LLFLKGFLSVALLLGPTILMGGTLPLLAAWLERSSTEAGQRSARFYSVNSLGAVAGAALAGFWLVQSYGLMATLWITASANLVVGTLAVALGQPLEKPASDAGIGSLEAESHESETVRWAGVTVALTGAVSMGLEVLSSRALALIFGSSLQTFAVVLIAFILGIGLGSAWIASKRQSASSSARLVVVLLCLAAAWVSLLVFNIERWVDLYRLAHTGLARTTVGYVFHQFFATAMSVIVLGFPAALIGAVLPLMIRTVSVDGGHLGSKVGRLLTWNTLGAVVGTLFTGFILMPAVGLRNAFAVLSLALGAAALITALRRNSWLLGGLGALATCALAFSLFVFGGTSWRYVMSSGIFRVRETEFNPRLMPVRKEHMKIVFYEDAPDATVSVEEVDGIIAPASLGLRINGKPDAGTQLDMGTQYLVSHLPMLVKPDAKDVFVLGIGSGITAGALLDYPVNHVDLAENCEPVIRAARLFGDWNNHVIDDPRVTIWCEDARTVLKLRPNKYDVIITVPSNPWTAGIGSVFSKEYYELAASRLKPGGIVAQWFQTYETQDDIVRLVLRTFSSVFSHVEIWDSGSDLVLLGSMTPWSTGPDVFRKGFAIDRVREDLWMIDIQSPESLMAKQLASQRTGFAIASPGPIQSDMFPRLEYEAPLAFYIGSGTRMLDAYDERTRQQMLAPPEKTAALHSLPLVNAQTIFGSFSTINGELYGCLFGNSLGIGVPCAFQTPNAAPAPDSDGTLVSQASRAFASGDLEKAARLAAEARQRNPDDALAGYLSRVIEREGHLRSSSGAKVASR
jgi:predicted membrane-bound spermidine synthase